MTSDGELLRRYTESHCEDAFAELVRRYLDLVYSAALRQVNGDAHLAQDVAQLVFTDLARKAGSLVASKALAGWLYTGAHYGAAKVVRAERRRQTREQEAHAMQELLHDSEPDPDWESLRPVLDTAMHELDASEREAILMRYFENRPHADIGQQLGLGENAARMRIERALEKLRTILSRRGITTSAAALSVVLTANAVQAAPAGLAVSISTAAALAGTTIAATATATATTTKAIVMTTLQKTIVTATVAVLAGAGIYEARQAAKRREQNQSLQQQQATLADQVDQLQRERDDATNRLASLAEENARLKQTPNELLKARGQVGVLRQQLQAATNAAQSATAANELAEALNTPAMRKGLAQARLAAYRQQYAPLIRQMKLTPEESDKFINLLGEHSRKIQDQSSAALREDTSTVAAFQSLQNLKYQLESELQAMLGSEHYAQYQEFKLNQSAQGTLDSFMKELPKNSLDQDQRQRLFQLFRANQPQDGELETWWVIVSPDETENYFQRLAEIDRNVLQQAGGFLASEQVTALASFQTDRISQQKEAVKLLRLMGTAGQGQSAGGNQQQ